MRVIIVDGTLDEVLSILEKSPMQPTNITPMGRGQMSPTKRAVRRSYRVAKGRSSRI